MWFKVDDKLHDHRKARAAGKSAMGVWVLAGSWSMDNDTDGFVPATVLSRWGTRTDATKLVTAGLWDPDKHDGEDGWRFHDWTRFQPSAAVTAAKQAAEHEAGVRGNHTRWHVRRGVTDPDCEYCYRVPDHPPDGGPDPVPDQVGVGSPESGPESAPIPPVPEPVPHTEPKGSARAAEPTAQTFVTEWIDHCAEKPPSRVVGQVAKELKVLIGDGIDHATIRRGLAEWNRKGLHPSTLASVVHEAQRNGAPLGAITDPSQLPPVEPSWMRRRRHQ